MSDDGPLLTDNTAAVFSEMERERDEALERLGPIDPAGNDRIDELESAIGFLRHDLDVAKRERDEAVAQRDKMRKRLQECVDAIATLPEDALGWGHESGPYEDQYPDSWPICDELLHHAREALAGLEEA